MNEIQRKYHNMFTDLAPPQSLDPVVIVLIGIPLSGKDTWIRQYAPNNFEVISRDNFITQNGSGSYRLDYNKHSSKIVDKLFFNALNQASQSLKNVIVNATHLTKARRRKVLLRFSNHYKIALVFPVLDIVAFTSRNEERKNSEGKYIPTSVYHQMVSLYEPVSDEENFDRVHFLGV